MPLISLKSILIRPILNTPDLLSRFGHDSEVEQLKEHFTRKPILREKTPNNKYELNLFGAVNVRLRWFLER